MGMRQDVKARWEAWLRSGVRQGNGKLCRTDAGPAGEPEFCCLGGLCELAVEDGVIERVETGYGYVTYGGEENYPPPAVIAWAGLTDVVQDRTVPGDVMVQDEADLVFEVTGESAPFGHVHADGRVGLAGLNDSRVPFEVIAEVVGRRL